MNAFGRAWLWLVGPPPIDGRGRRVHVTFVSGYPAAWWSKIHKLPPDVHRRVRSRCERMTIVWTAQTVVFSILVVVPWLALLSLPHRFVSSGMAMRWWSFAPQVLGHAFFLGTSIWYGSRMTARIRIEALLDEAICPSCRYPIAGIPTAEDGCIICPECGAAWRLPAHASGDQHAP